MTVYKKNKRTGFIETLETDGNYKPIGWSITKTAANRRKS